MYYPYLRGKQFELVMLREQAENIARWGFVPIIEPVRENFPALKRALTALVENNCHFILIANPSVGQLVHGNGDLREQIFEELLGGYPAFQVGLCLTQNSSVADVDKYFTSFELPTAVIHKGFSDGRVLAETLAEYQGQLSSHVFVGLQAARMYRRHFTGITRVIVEDGFNKPLRNADYPASERYSDLYLTYGEVPGEAFGDFLVVGDDYSDGGGPAFAVAIHLTYAEPDDEGQLYINHYVSTSNKTAADTAGKFAEALEKLVADVSSPGTKVFRSNAVAEYLRLHQAQHFPGLGYIKKLSMQHHMELMAHLLGR
ncbi:MAG: ATP-binding protein [Pseudohongiella sp.]|nr:ATP-binding protein [Pseudohongiella sp.]|tara:strand:- start:1477 stop:2421 length:945 start_codon:yes stop_codon:yes gene_type:complete